MNREVQCQKGYWASFFEITGCRLHSLPNPKPQTRNPKPQTRNPKPVTPNLKPQTSNT